MRIMGMQIGKRDMRTSLVEMKGILPNGNRLFAKCEFENQTHYARVWPHVIEMMEKEQGLDRKKHVLLENSSGNSGLILAWEAKKRKYGCTLVLPETVNDMKKRRIETLGSKTISLDDFLTERNIPISEFLRYMRDEMGPEAKVAYNAIVEHILEGNASAVLRQDSDILEAKRREILEFSYVLGTNYVIRKIKNETFHNGKKYFFLNHSKSQHALESLSPMVDEIVGQMGNKKVDCFVPAIGNGLSAFGPGLRLREYYPKMRIAGFEAGEAPWASYMKYSDGFSKVYGIEPDFTLHGSPGVSGYGIRFHFLDEYKDFLNEIVHVYKREWENEITSISIKINNDMHPWHTHYQISSLGATSRMGICAAFKLAQRTRGENYLIILYEGIGEMV